MVPVRLFISFSAAAFAAGFGASAQAWEVCNETSFVQRVAVATTIDSAVTPKGWTRACALQNMGTRDYLAVDPAESVTRLVEIEDFGERANTAGIQRLLRDVGYSISKIDGREGRRTRRSLSAFFKDRDMRTPSTEEEIIDALECRRSSVLHKAVFLLPGVRTAQIAGIARPAFARCRPENTA